MKVYIKGKFLTHIHQEKEKGTLIHLIEVRSSETRTTHDNKGIHVCVTTCDELSQMKKNKLKESNMKIERF